MSRLSFRRISISTACFASAAVLLTACGGGSGSSQVAGAVDATAAGNAAEVQTVTPAASTQLSPAVQQSVTAETSAAASTSPTAPTAGATAPAPSPAPAPASTTAAPAPSNVVLSIDYYGDSTVWGYASGVGGQVAKPAPTVFSETLAATRTYNVRNEGVSGTTACDLLNGTDGKHPAWDAQLASSNATYVIVNHAINDEWKYDLNTYKSCLHSLAQKAKNAGKRMIFETPNPTRDSGPGGLDTMVDAMKEVAAQEQVPVIDQYKYLTNYLNGASPYDICPDGLHPSDAVYAMKGKYAAGAFLNLFPN